MKKRVKFPWQIVAGSISGLATCYFAIRFGSQLGFRLEGLLVILGLSALTLVVVGVTAAILVIMNRRKLGKR